MSEIGWFLLFWSFFVGLGLLEMWMDRDPGLARRSRRWPANLGLGFLNGAVFSVVPAGLVGISALAADRGFGLLNDVAAPFWIAVVLTVLARSLAQYFFHRIAHAVPALWLAHRVHHSDTHLDGSTGLRFHPIEYVANLLFVAPVAMLLGFDAATLAIYEMVEALVGIASHTSLRLPERLDRLLRLVVVTPGMHTLHHSIVRRESDSNFATTFSFWDRLFGTYCAAPADAAAFRHGLPGVGRDEAANFHHLLTWPMRRTPPADGGTAAAVASGDLSPPTGA